MVSVKAHPVGTKLKPEYCDWLERRCNPSGFGGRGKVTGINNRQ